MGDKAFAGKVAWITGGATGQGRAIALRLAREGADIAIGSLTAPARKDVVPNESVLVVGDEDLRTTQAEIEALGVRCLARSLDVASDESVQASYDAVMETFGKIDILVNCAGAGSGGLFAEGFPDEVWNRAIEVNLTGTFRTIRRCFPGMVARRWGRIVSIASTAGMLGSSGSASYSAAKAGLIILCRCAGLEGAPHNVTSNTISPGYVRTRQVRINLQRRIDRGPNARGAPPPHVTNVDEFLDDIASEQPSKRLMEPEDIANTAVFLCRDESSGINGENIRVSGGAMW